MGVSRRAYALHRGVSHTAVAKAIASGRIGLEPDGTIDPEKADRQWDANTDPAQQRGAHARAMGLATSQARMRDAQSTTPAATAAGMKAVPRSAIESMDETLREAGEPEPGTTPDGEGEVSFMRARMANEVLKAETVKVRLQRMKGELVDRNRATAAVYDLARRERDAWLGWPPRIAANMAAELGVDPHALEQALGKYLRLQLAELAEVKLELR